MTYVAKIYQICAVLDTYNLDMILQVKYNYADSNESSRELPRVTGNPRNSIVCDAPYLQNEFGDPLFFYVFNITLVFSTYGQSFKKICPWQLLGANFLKDHVDHIRKVLRRLREHAVKLKPKRCRLFKREVNYLKQIVSAAGYRLDHSNGEVWRLLGLLGYYRRYIQNFAMIAHPLFQLLQAPSKDVAKSAYTTSFSTSGVDGTASESF